jgi:hypothetical protein
MAVTDTEHDYSTCRDEDCPRFPCRVYKEGAEAGYDAGFAAGYGEGYADGFAEGFSAASKG